MTDAMRNLYRPPEVAEYTMEIVERRYKERGLMLNSDISTLDKVMKPLLPGEVVVISAMTSHGKTSFMQCWARNVVSQLVKRDDTKQIAVYASWETGTEELGLYDLASATGVDSTNAWYGDIPESDIEKLRMAAVRRAASPMWVIGRSLKRRKQAGRVTIPMLGEVLHTLEESEGITAPIIFLDYVQRATPIDARKDRRIQVMQNVDAVFDIAASTGASVVVGSQAGRGPGERDFKLPEVGDNQETSRIEQDADKVIALWYPCKTEGIGETIRELNVVVDENLIICGIRKQRRAASGQIFPLYFDPVRNHFAAWDHGQKEYEDGVFDL